MQRSRHVMRIATTSTTSNRVNETLDPCVVLMKQLIAKHQHLWTDEKIYSLAQGVVYWNPPQAVNDAMVTAINDPTTTLHSYAPDEGLPELVSAIKLKLRRENNLPSKGSSQDDIQVIVTPGANAAYMNCVLTLLSENELSVVFKPYYFNHVMAIQMTRGQEALLVGPIDDDGCPSMSWLKEQLEEKGKQIKMITITNPGNPTGVSLPTSKLQEIVDLCRDFGVFVVFDNTYEQFDHTGANTFETESGDGLTKAGFHCFSDEHVINIFSFSKGYAMAGYRVGYVVVNTCGEDGKNVYEQMVKVQDTIPICTSRISQKAAMGALSEGRPWVERKVKTLDEGREAILDALEPLEKTIGGSGAMYCMAKLPSGIDDMQLAEELVEKYGIAIIPGKFCGLPGWIRVCYSNLPTKECKIAAGRLKKGLIDLCVRPTTRAS
eukprot:scaffold1910_cov225-Chaetoceros_neogracile.AAC.3